MLSIYCQARLRKEEREKYQLRKATRFHLGEFIHLDLYVSQSSEGRNLNRKERKRDKPKKVCIHKKIGYFGDAIMPTVKTLSSAENHFHLEPSANECGGHENDVSLDIYKAAFFCS